LNLFTQTRKESWRASIATETVNLELDGVSSYDLRSLGKSKWDSGSSCLPTISCLIKFCIAQNKQRKIYKCELSCRIATILDIPERQSASAFFETEKARNKRGCEFALIPRMTGALGETIEACPWNAPRLTA